MFVRINDMQTSGMNSCDSKLASPKVCLSGMSRAIYQLNCFGQERSTQGILWATRWRMLLQAGRPPSVNLLRARLDTSRKQTSSADKCFCVSLPSRVLLPNTFPSLSLWCRWMILSRSPIHGSSQILCLRLPLFRGSAKSPWRTASVSSAMQAILFSGGSRGCTARDVCRLSPNQCSRNGSAQARAQVRSVAMLLDLLPAVWKSLMRVSHQRRLRREGLLPASCTLRIVPIRSEATSGAGNAALGDPPILASYASPVRRPLPGRERKLSLESAEGSHRSHMPSGSWRSMSPTRRFGLILSAVCVHGLGWLLDCGTALADLSVWCFPCCRKGRLSGFQELFPSWTLVSPCVLHFRTVLRFDGLVSPSRGCVVADRSVARFCGLRPFLHDLSSHVSGTGALVATSDVSCVKLLRELKSWRYILSVSHGVLLRFCLLFATELVVWRVVCFCEEVCQLCEAL